MMGIMPKLRAMNWTSGRIAALAELPARMLHHWLQRWQTRRQAAECAGCLPEDLGLRQLSDHELSDIGLRRPRALVTYFPLID